MPLEFGDQLEMPAAILELGARAEKIARVGEAVGADRTQFRQAEQRPVVLADGAAAGLRGSWREPRRAGSARSRRGSADWAELGAASRPPGHDQLAVMPKTRWSSISRAIDMDADPARALVSPLPLSIARPR
jgi:hypothetical protein